MQCTQQQQQPGASILCPPTTMALSPHSHVFPPLFSATPSPQTIFGHCIRNVVQFMRVFSEFWKLSVMDNDPSKTKEYKWSW